MPYFAGKLELVSNILWMIEVLPLELKRAGCLKICKGTSNRGFHYCTHYLHGISVLNFFRFNDENNVKRRGVCIRFKESLPLQ